MGVPVAVTVEAEAAEAVAARDDVALAHSSMKPLLMRGALWSATGLMVAALTIRVRPTQPLRVEPISHAQALARAMSLPPAMMSRAPSAAALPAPHASTLRRPAVDADLASHLALIGTARTPEPFAWIEDVTLGRTRRYRQGEQVLDARLAFIGSGLVWLEREGVLTQLRLVDSRAQEDAHAALPSSEPVAIRVPTRTGEEAMRIRPERAPDGTFAGLAVESIAEQTPWLARLGLQPGDRIVAINSQPLVSPQQALQVLRKATAQPALAVALYRNGRLRTVSLPRTL